MTETSISISFMREDEWSLIITRWTPLADAKPEITRLAFAVEVVKSLAIAS